jgi:hypothetical protein
MKRILLALALFAGFQVNAQFYLWAHNFGSVNGGEQGHKVITDASGNVYVIGQFDGTVDFDPSPAVANLSAPAFTQDIFVAKYDSYGAYIWAFNLGGTNNQAFANDIVLDPTGNYLYLTGSFQGTVDFDPSPAIANQSVVGGEDAFLAKYSTSTGAYQWAFKMGGTLNDEGYGVACDAFGNVYVTGAFETTVDFDPSAATFNLTSGGLNDVFIAKYSSAMGFLWAGRIGGTQTDYGYGIKVDASNIYITGSFAGTADFDPSATTVNITSNGNLDAFVGKYTLAGVYVKAFKIGGTLADNGYALALDASSNIYVTGSFQNTADFDPSAGVQNRTSAGGTDIFVAKYATGMTYVNAFAIGSPNPDLGSDIIVDGAGSNIYVTGSYGGTADFDPSASVFDLLTTNPSEMFVAKYSTAMALGWAINATGTTTDSGLGVAVDATNHVYATGSFNTQADFDPSASVANLISNGSDDIYLAKYGPAPCNPSTLPTVTSTSSSFCVGGSATLNVTAGSLNDASHWEWSTGSCGGTIVGSGTSLAVTPVTTTTYYVRGQGGCVTSGSCTPITITVNPLPVPAISSSTNISCFGGNNGSINLNVTSGSPAYTYSWSNSATTQNLTTLTSGSYTVVVTDANGCTGTTNTTLTQPASALSVTSAGSAIACFGGNTGTVTSTPSGGTPSYTYSWSNAATTQNQNTLIAGTYTLLLTDSHGCTATTTATITQAPQLLVTIAQVDVSCHGGNNGSLTATVTGGTPTYLYSWSNGASTASNPTLTAGSYTLTVTDFNGCLSTSTYTVTEPPVLTCGTTSTPDTVANDGTTTLTVNGGTAPYTYSWSNASSSQNLSGLTGGTYTVVVTDANGCATTSTVVVTSSVGILEYTNLLSYKLYPNPATDEVTLELNALYPHTTVTLTDVLGHTVFTEELTQAISTLHLQQLDRGIYFIRIASDGSNRVNQKIILK